MPSLASAIILCINFLSFFKPIDSFTNKSVRWWLCIVQLNVGRFYTSYLRTKEIRKIIKIESGAIFHAWDSTLFNCKIMTMDDKETNS